MNTGHKHFNIVNVLSSTLRLFAILCLAEMAAAQSSVIVSEEFTWQAASVADHTCKTYKHTIAGPGVLTVRTKMAPFRVRDLGMSTEDILTHSLGYFAASLGQTVNGTKDLNINDFQGKPVDRISRWNIDNKKYDTEFRVCNPVKCNLAGDCSQYQATASIVIDFAASSATSAEGNIGSAANIIGTWVVIENGKVVDRLDVSVLGDGFMVEARASDNAPPYWTGFGILEGGRLFVSTRNTSSGASGLVVMTFSGARVHYRSYYLDGRQAWDGDFARRP